LVVDFEKNAIICSSMTLIRNYKYTLLRIAKKQVKTCSDNLRVEVDKLISEKSDHVQNAIFTSG